MRTLKELAQEAIAIQDASNILGLSKGYARVLQELAEVLLQLGLPGSTLFLERHPVNLLWISKLADLSRYTMIDEKNLAKYSLAYDDCKRLTEPKCARTACDGTGVLKHSDNHNLYCIRCARKINEAADRVLFVWPEDEEVHRLKSIGVDV